MTAASKDRDFKNHAHTQEEEDAYDYLKFRTGIRPTSFIGAVAHMVKGALGGGILGGPVAYMKGGLAVSLPIHVMIGVFMGYCMHLLVQCTQILMRRTRKPFLSYADCGEAAMMLFPKKNVAKYAKHFRYLIDTLICMDLFGACCCYHIIIAKSIKQLIENTRTTSMSGPPGYPSLRMYMLIFIPFYILICLITHLKYLVPFSLGANAVVASAIVMAIYYCFLYNPAFEGLKLATSFEGALQFIGMSVFAMSCSGVVIPVEGNMRDPKKFPKALVLGLCGLYSNLACTYVPGAATFPKLWYTRSVQIFACQGAIVFCTCATSFFGYAAFKDKAEAPFTINFPMTTVPIIFKVAICVMLYVTHAVNFWVPFNLCWYYIGKRVNQNRLMMWERIFRTIFVLIIGVVAIIFPSIIGIMGFTGCFCITNMAIIWPSIISVLVLYERPGLGRYYWRLWRSVFFIVFGLFIMIGCFCITNMAIIWPSIISVLVVYERPGLGRYYWRLWRSVFFIVFGLFIMVCGSIVNAKTLAETIGL